MGKINRFLLMLIAMLMIMIAAVGIDRGMKYGTARRWEKERVARYEQTYAEATDIEMKIRELSQDQEAIETFIAEHSEYFEDETDGQGFLESQDKMDGQEGPDGSYGSGENAQGASSGEAFDVSGNLSGSVQGVWPDGILVNEVYDLYGNQIGAVSGNELFDVSGNRLGLLQGIGEDSVSGNNADSWYEEWQEDTFWNALLDVSGNRIGTISGNEIYDLYGNRVNAVSDNELLESEASGTGQVSQEKTFYGKTLHEKRKVRTSYMETQMQNELDRKAIRESSVDFSGISIACLGDSITEAANLDDLEEYQQYSYPTKLGRLLGAENVSNLGIGGSSIGRYWDNAFVDRYRSIPEDTDLILVMGGTNDGFCMDEEELGTMEERKEKTFIGDLDELMRGLKEDYPDAKIVFITPLPNVLHDILRTERDYLLPQTAIVNAIKELAQEYEIPVIDLYNSNILDTHDAAVIYNYMPDGVHCNSEGYSLLAEHIAAELIRIYEEE